MYDPARDIFTASDDASADQNEPKDREPEKTAATPEGPSVSDTEGDTTEKIAEAEEAPVQPKSEQPLGPSSDSIETSDTSSIKFSNPSIEQAPPEKTDTTSMGTKVEDGSSLLAEAPSGQGASNLGETARESKTEKRKREDPSVEEETRPSHKRPTGPSRNGSHHEYDSPVPMTSANLPRFARRKDGGDTPKRNRRSGTPPERRSHRDRYRDSGSRERRSRSRSPRRHAPDSKIRERRSPPRRRSPSPRRRSPSPARRSPPRKLKRPGGASRISNEEKEAIRRRQVEREEADAKAAKAQAVYRGVHDVVRQHYNAVPERGREFRKTDSKIRGLRSFNNWVKSTIIQKFSPNEDYTPGARRTEEFEGDGPNQPQGLLVLDIGCGKGGDLFKWQQAPQTIDLYVGVDPADISIQQAQERYRELREGGGRGGRGGRGGFRGGRKPRVFHGEFFVKDAFGEWLGDIPLIREVGIDGGVGPGGGGAMSSRWGGGGFDVVSMMFCMHYAFENEQKARGMLKNVAGSLKKGGRFLGVIPNSDILTDRVSKFHERSKASKLAVDPDGVASASSSSEKKENEADADGEEPPNWSNSIYRVRFPGKTPEDGIFRPPFGWKYSYFMEEAVEEVPEYVVPWEAFRALAEDYNLELQYRKPFTEIWREEKDDPVLGPLSERMHVRERDRGPLLVSDEEMEAAGFYHAFCFYKEIFRSDLAMVADALVYHPSVAHYLKFVATTVGRDKVLRALQYFSRFYAWYLYRTNYAPTAIAPYEAMKKQFGLIRKAMRLGKNVEHFKAAAVAMDSKNLDPVLRYCAVGRQLGYGFYLSFDAVAFLDNAGIRPTPAAKRLQQEAYRAWFVGLLFGTVANVYTLYQVQLKQKAIDKKDGEGVVESKKLERFGYPSAFGAH
ncbi:MAG: hypothetical protein M4579_006997 [Chaenotheca gracillima]|nr:MAG: hypothetical protein M4579_006997 [Chaenotheca gracillima]